MPTCDACGKQEAAYTVTEVDKEGVTRERHFCAACAEARGLLTEKKLTLAELFAALIAEPVADRDRTLICRRCGMSFADFRRLGRLGCAECYTAFAEALRPIIERVQGASRHAGRRVSPGAKRATRTAETQRLRAELARAIAHEEYEKAARLRDALRAAEEQEPV